MSETKLDTNDKHAAECFAANPKIDKLFQAKDGICFEDEDTATNYQLRNKWESEPKVCLRKDYKTAIAEALAEPEAEEKVPAAKPVVKK